jgi:N-acetylneuraminate synthase
MMRTKLIAEIGINHNADLNIAKSLIQVCKLAGVDVVKFQKRNPDKCVPEHQKNVMRDTPWGEMTYLEYKYKMEFGEEEYDEIDAFCRSLGILWTASVWDVDSLHFMNRYDVPFIKIPSALITDKDLLSACAFTKRPVILSTGMATMDMVDDAVNTPGLEVVGILHCVSTYPSAPEEQNLLCIRALKNRFPEIPIGFSNHHPGLTFLTAAPALGAEILEFHITQDRAMWGTDQAASIEPEGVFHLVKRVRNIEKALGDGVKKIMPSEVPIMRKLRG